MRTIEELRMLALQGNDTAQYDLGKRLYYGDSVEKDAIEAVRLFKNAAAQGNVDAMLMLGSCYAIGEGVEANNYTSGTGLAKPPKRGALPPRAL